MRRVSRSAPLSLSTPEEEQYAADPQEAARERAEEIEALPLSNVEAMPFLSMTPGEETRDDSDEIVNLTEDDMELPAPLASMARRLAGEGESGVPPVPEPAANSCPEDLAGIREEARKRGWELQTLTEEAVRLYGDKLTNANVVDDVIDFMLGRFRAWYQDEGYTVDTIQAVLARRPTRPADFDARMKAVSHFRTLEAASALAAANKRVSNILAKSEETLNDRVNAATLKEPEEIALAMQVVVLRDKLEPVFAAGHYQEALVELAELREPVDAFFEKVMVNVEDKDLRINRLSMLEKLRELFLRVADISLLQ